MGISGRLSDLIFGNFIPILLFLGLIYVGVQVKKLSDYRKEIQKRFDQVLTEYLNNKINYAKGVINDILAEYGREDTVSTEINRLMIAIEKGASGDINDKVMTSNAINKFKLSKSVDLEKYPSMSKLNGIGVFNEQEMASVDNGVALARKEYNMNAFRYNQVASGFPMQYLVKLFGFKHSYIIFGNTKNVTTEATIEVLDDSKEEINSITSLNRVNSKQEDLVKQQDRNTEDVKEVIMDYSDVVLKPTQNLNNIGEKNNANHTD